MPANVEFTFNISWIPVICVSWVFIYSAEISMKIEPGFQPIKLVYCLLLQVCNKKSDGTCQSISTKQDRNDSSLIRVEEQATSSP